MTFGILTVTGYMVLLLFAGLGFYHFISQAFNAHDSVHIDKKPDTN